MLWGRSIPSYVGEPGLKQFKSIARMEHPLVCGGTYHSCLSLDFVQGASPRMWGNHVTPPFTSIPIGSIPSYVGEPARGGYPARVSQEHPLVCGGTIMNRYRLASGWGASPRMWGNLRDDKTVVNGFGSIPSYVGEPTGPGPRAGRDTEHPLVCGGTRHLPARRGPEHGASPRMWGNPLGRDILYPFLTLLWTLSCWWEGGPSSGGWRFGAFGHDMPCPACRGVLFSVR